MNFQQMQDWLAMEEAAQRETWDRHLYVYLEPADGPGAMRQLRWDELTDTTSKPVPYAPTAEDLAATDWIAYVG